MELNISWDWETGRAPRKPSWAWACRDVCRICWGVAWTHKKQTRVIHMHRMNPIKWKWSDMWPSMVTHTQNLCSAFNPSKCTHTQQWTHTHTVNTHSGSQWGAVGGSVPCSRVSPQSWYWRWRGGESAGYSLPPPATDNCWRTWDSNPQPSGYKSDSLSIRPRLPPHIWYIIGVGLAKSLARRPGAIVFSSRATKMYHRSARRATLNTGLPRNVPSKLRARGRPLLQPRPRRRNNVPLARKN